MFKRGKFPLFIFIIKNIHSNNMKKYYLTILTILIVILLSASSVFLLIYAQRIKKEEMNFLFFGFSIFIIPFITVEYKHEKFNFFSPTIYAPLPIKRSQILINEIKARIIEVRILLCYISFITAFTIVAYKANISLFITIPITTATLL